LDDAVRDPGTVAERVIQRSRDKRDPDQPAAERLRRWLGRFELAAERPCEADVRDDERRDEPSRVTAIVL